MQKLNLDSELLKPMREQLEIIINKLTGIVATQNKEAEIVLKINLDSIKQFEEVDDEKVKEWVEPRIEYSISEKIKEVKNTNKGNLGFDYQVKVDEETNETYVEKINEQTIKQKKKNNKRKKHTGLKVFIIILIILGICGGIFAKKVHDLDGNWLAALFGHNKETLKNLDKLEVLIMGESTGSSDTMIVCSYDPKTQKASMLSIPRDTFIGDNTQKARPGNKLNSFYSNGSTPEKTIEAINKVTGLNIKNYILVDTKALKELVNIIGEIEFKVPMDMDYDDDTQDLHIHLKEGLQKLDGDKVEQVVRFRHNNDGSTYSYKYGQEDYGRMRTQRELIKTVLKQTIQFKNIKEIGKIMDLAKDYVQTNMEFSSLKDYIPYIVNIDVDGIQTEQLPGESKVLNGIWFFLNDKEETKEVVDRLFRDGANNQNENTTTNTAD